MSFRKPVNPVYEFRRATNPADWESLDWLNGSLQVLLPGGEPLTAGLSRYDLLDAPRLFDMDAPDAAATIRERIIQDYLDQPRRERQQRLEEGMYAYKSLYDCFEALAKNPIFLEFISPLIIRPKDLAESIWNAIHGATAHERTDGPWIVQNRFLPRFIGGLPESREDLERKLIALDYGTYAELLLDMQRQSVFPDSGTHWRSTADVPRNLELPYILSYIFDFIDRSGYDGIKFGGLVWATPELVGRAVKNAEGPEGVAPVPTLQPVWKREEQTPMPICLPDRSGFRPS